jgi:hypothetical protein
VHAFNPSTSSEAKAGEFLSSRPARTTQRNPVSKKQKKKKKKEIKGAEEMVLQLRALAALPEAIPSNHVNSG